MKYLKSVLSLSLRAAAVTGCVALLCGCYMFKQSRLFLKYSMEAKQIKKLQRSADIPGEEKAFLALVEEVRGFATDSIGLAKNSNFSKYINVRKDHIVDVVYAAGKLNFIPYKWRFPFIGSFPNKGFFDRSDAVKEAEALKAKGFDVCILGADAFSTLGFFSDPLYSFMKRFTPFRLAYIIFHEQTHATLFIKNQLQFNEEMATFIGNEGALRFIRGKFGDTSEQYKNALHEIDDESAFSTLMKSLKEKLACVYDSAGITDENKLRLKQTIIARFKDSVAQNYDSLFRSQGYRGLSKADINNALIVADMTYTLNLSLFRDLYERKNRDLRAMVESLKSLKKKKGDPHELIGKL